LVAVFGLGACGGVEAGVTAGTAAPPATTLPAAPTTMATVTATLPIVTGPPVVASEPVALPATTTPPPLPPPCDPSVLGFDASPVSGGELVVTITNTGGDRCEANLKRSPGVDPRMEPDVWLDPGASAELLVEVDTRICVAPIDVDAIDLDVNGVAVAVSVAPMRVCILTLTALYPA
jgi:hypothetical protein